MRYLLERFSPTLKDHFGNYQIPEYLYHYTSGAGLIGILGEQKIRMGGTDYLNDREEMKHFLRVVQRAARQMMDSGEHSDTEIDILKKVASDSLEDIPYCFVASFTEYDDQLSQWRAYCPDSGGYALGIPAKHLDNLVEDMFIQKHKEGPFDKYGAAAAQGELQPNINSKYLFIKCIYKTNLQEQIAQEILTYVVGNNQYYGIRIPSGDSSDDEAIIKYKKIMRLMSRVSTIFKNPAFKEEEEWRIISPLSSGNNLGFTETKRGLVMYDNLSLNATYAKLRDATTKSGGHLKIICGPAANPIGSRRAAERLMRSNKLFASFQDESCVTSSKVPYKTW